LIGASRCRGHQAANRERASDRSISESRRARSPENWNCASGFRGGSRFRPPRFDGLIAFFHIGHSYRKHHAAHPRHAPSARSLGVVPGASRHRRINRVNDRVIGTFWSNWISQWRGWERGQRGTRKSAAHVQLARSTSCRPRPVAAWVSLICRYSAPKCV
jgi:hypothetical protein